jgi:hypothetical protein
MDASAYMQYFPEPPLEMDRTTQEAFSRMRICSDISGTRIFQQYNCESVNMEEIYDELRQPKYSDIFHLIYRPTLSQDSSHPYEYVNPYRLGSIEFIYDGHLDPDLASRTVVEHIFVCLLRQQTASNDIIPYYVSKAYYNPSYQGHRFLFFQGHPNHPNSLMMLVETSAEVYERPDFDVELHYLELREVHQPGR